ncbi:copper homeostasis protein CutC [Arsenicitalea aurantiaca]|uniref:PF03932 family protein CutC n=1 Tax=Arsenicitalea aurantiaca TaxID=1783274 RepID=A0A433X8E0_9HYPH|nr:copper homeostasis protein CutC [Arsenicitalea aurantiaca]RUT30336.1 copper homeostasis protein CutC [Arsenicitalea aurantiaca]
MSHLSVARPLVELCVEGVDGAIAAEAGGADRVELCASLLEGGITPGIGVVARTLDRLSIPVHVIVRPRGGDFHYSEEEFAAMGEELRALARMGVPGAVIGCLLPEGVIDEDRMARLVEAAGPMSVTCHRAFDMTRDPEEAVEALIRVGVARVLTSGQRDSAAEGLPILRRTIAAAGDRLVVMVCGGLDETNIARIASETGAAEFHFSAPSTGPSAMVYRNPHVGMGGTALSREYELTVTDPEAVARTIAALRGA